MATRSVIEILVEAKDKGTDLLKRASSALRGIREETQRLSAAQARAAADPAYGRSAQYLIDRATELKDRTTDTRKAIEALSQGLQGSDSKSVNEYRAHVQRLRDQIDRLELAEQADIQAKQKLRAATDEAAKSSKRFEGAGNALHGVFRRLIAAALLFVSAQRINQFLRDSVKQFVENTEEAESLREGLDNLKKAWFELKATIGAVIVELFGVGEQTSAVTGHVQDLRFEIDTHRKQIIAWARVVFTTLKEVGRGVTVLAKTAFNAGQIIGTGAEAIVAYVVGAIVKVIQTGIEQVNKLIQMYNDLPSVFKGMQDTQIPLIPLGRDPGALFEVGKGLIEAIGRDLEQIDADLVSMGGSWQAINTAIEGARSAGEESIRTFTRLEEERAAAAKKAKEEVLDFEKLRMEAFLRRAQSRRLGGGRPAFPGGPAGPVPLDRVPFIPLPTEETGGFPGLGGKLPEVSGAGAGFGAWFQFEAEQAVEGIGTIDEAFAELAVGGLLRFGEAFSDTIADVISGSTTVGEALRRSILGAVAEIAAAKGRLYGLDALAALAAHDYSGAAKFFAASAGMYALAGVLKGIGGRGGAVGAGGAAGGGLSAASQREQAGRNQGSLTIAIYGDDPVSIFDWSKPTRMDAFVGMMERATGRRVVVERR